MPVEHLRAGDRVLTASARKVPVVWVGHRDVECAGHDVLLAVGLACESHLDTGNRAAFGGGP